MPRPKGTFMKPKDFAQLTPEQKEKYRANHADYLRNFARREEKKRKIPNWQEKWRREKDAEVLIYDMFPESSLREWFRTNVKTCGDRRMLAARWGTEVFLLVQFLSGHKILPAFTLHNIQADTGISMERLVLEFDAIRAGEKKDEPAEG